MTKNKAKFEEIPVGNDIMFGTLTGSWAYRIGAYNVLMYYVTNRDGSLTQLKSSVYTRCRFAVRIRQRVYMVQFGKPQYAMDLFRYSIKYVLPISVKDWIWCLGEMVKHRINPFVCLYKIKLYL